MKFALATLLANHAAAKVFFQESFDDGKWSDRWSVPSSWKPKAEMGTWDATAGRWYGDDKDLALRTTEDARFYGLSVPLDSPITNKNTDLVLQYTMKAEQSLNCGGAYIKLLDGGDDFDAASFGGETPYEIMFGPDKCSSNSRTHVIISKEGQDDNVLITKDVKMETDSLSHLYTLHIKADNTFDVLIDNVSVRSGNLEDEFDLLKPKSIPDAADIKPSDWKDSPTMPDPDDKKPEGYDDIPAELPDPSASKPDDWDDEDDGEWEAPTIPNPEFKGDWRPKMVPDPDYKGQWVQKEIPNPDYVADANLHARCDPCTHLGIEIWVVDSGTSYDDVIVTDDLKEAQAHAEKFFFKKQKGEKQMYDTQMEIEREEAAKAREEAAAQAAFEEGMEEEHEEL